MLIKNSRQDKMLQILSKENTMKISELSDRLNASMMTIRRDLDFLEKNGIVKRFHGGVVLTKSDSAQPSFYERIEEFSAEKNRIGRAAASLIRPGSIVFFDAGTTCLAVVDHIPNELQFTAITTGLLTAAALCAKPNVNVVSVGGNVHPTSYSSVNYIAVEQIKRFHADMAFISTKSVILPIGTFEVSLPLIEVKKAIVESSEEAVLLADGSKFANKSMCQAVPMSAVDTVISDASLDPDSVRQMEEQGIRVILAEAE